MSDLPTIVPGFARVRLGEKITRLIQIVCVTPMVVTGREVSRRGEPVPSRDVVVCRPDEILERLVLNTSTGQLEPE